MVMLMRLGASPWRRGAQVSSRVDAINPPPINLLNIVSVPIAPPDTIVIHTIVTHTLQTETQKLKYNVVLI
jgi:hypothetical protein